MTDSNKFRLELANVNRSRVRDNLLDSKIKADAFWSEFVANRGVAGGGD